jgi:hypothetical protein
MTVKTACFQNKKVILVCAKIKIMKKIFFILFCISSSIYAQYPVLSTTSLIDPLSDVKFNTNGNYAVDTNNELDQYVGLWRYNQNGVLFELLIEKRIKYMGTKIEYQNGLWYNYSDCALFRYKLVKNGSTLYDNLNTPIPQFGWSSQGLKYGIYNYISGSIIDYTRNVLGSVDIKKLPTSGGQQKIFFNLGEGTYLLLNPISYYQGSSLPLFNIPTNGIEMVKVN